jgi:hypothetical protein
VLYVKNGVNHWSMRLDMGAQFLLLHDSLFNITQFAGADRVVLDTEVEIYSLTLTGTDRIDYASVPTPEILLSNTLIVGDALIYKRTNVGQFQLVPPSMLFAVPLAGGTAVPLDSEQFYSYAGGAIGARVVYHRCAIGNLSVCDVVSIQNDGTNRVVLASEPANEAVQGVTTNQVIIRRNLSGRDQLIAVPVAGGPETVLMTMTDDEFVDVIVGDLIILRLPSGTWSLDLSGALKQLGTAKADGFTAVGDAICSSDTVWCMPLDGTGPQVQIAPEGKVVGVL